MKEQWLAWSEKFSALTQREKLIIGVAAVFLSGYLLFMLLVEPKINEQQSMTKKLASKTSEIATVRSQILDLQAALSKDPNEQIKQDIATMKTNLLDVEASLDKVMMDYVAPDRMTRELTSLLNSAPNVRVIGVTTLAPKELKTSIEQEGSSGSIAPYFYHEFELVIEGQYFTLMNFLQRIMASNKKFTVTDLDYSVTEHPTAQMTLSLVTISDSENVIRL